MLNKPFLKIIAGIENRNLAKVMDLLDAAIFCQADAVDICDEEEIIIVAREKLQNTNTKLFVSSLEEKRLLRAHQLGADYLELGNYDHLYPLGQEFPAQDILKITSKLIAAGLNNLSVTVPANLSPNTQASLAQELVREGVLIIQTEGASLVDAAASGAVGHIEKAKMTLANTIELKRACPEACIMAAGGLSNTTVPLALAAGASGIGIGKAISRLGSQIEMIAGIKAIQEAMKQSARAIV